MAAAAIVTAVIAVVSAIGQTVSTARAQSQRKKDARKAESLGKAQIAERQRLANIERQRKAAETKRLARLRAAKTTASFTGAGAGGSIIEGALAGLETSEASSQEYIQQVGASQEAQFGIMSSQISQEADAIANAANTQIQNSLINLGIGAVKAGSAGYSAYSSASATGATGNQASSAGLYAGAEALGSN